MPWKRQLSYWLLANSLLQRVSVSSHDCLSSVASYSTSQSACNLTGTCRLTTWFIDCCCPRSQMADLAPCRFTRHVSYNVGKLFTASACPRCNKLSKLSCRDTNPPRLLCMLRLVIASNWRYRKHTADTKADTWSRQMTDALVLQ